MKRLAVLLGLLICSASLVLAMGGSAPAATQKEAVEVGGDYLIDNFESGGLKSRGWWTFDLGKAAVVENDSLSAGEKDVIAKKGKYSLILEGKAKNWYAGGAGAYLAKENQDLSGYDSIQLDIYGIGPDSGSVKIELLDDDNNNWQVEQDPKNSYAAVYDDKFVYDIKVDWQGWQRLNIPLADFVDDNANVGDNVWNPQQANGSGGLLQIQLICLATKDTGSVKLYVDNLVLTKSAE